MEWKLCGRSAEANLIVGTERFVATSTTKDGIVQDAYVDVFAVGKVDVPGVDSDLALHSEVHGWLDAIR